MKKGITYKDAGVDVDLGNDVSKILYNAARQTWINRRGMLGDVIVPFDDFTGVRAIDVSNLPAGTLMNMSFDGIGTKVEIAERVGDHSTMAYDLFAMVCDDAVVRGAEPILVGTILDVNSLNRKGPQDNSPFISEVHGLAQGYIDAARKANVAIINGEVAELGSRVGGFGGFNYNWGAGVVWFAKKDRIFTGLEVKEGDSLVGLQENGFRSNGISLVRKIMEKSYGPNWHTFDRTGDHSPNRSMAREILTPSTIYTSAAVSMFGGYDNEPNAEIHGIAHITGGGVPEKLGRMLKRSGLGAVIDNPLKPSSIMKYVQGIGEISDRVAYSTWNMGHGMIIATPQPEEVMAIAEIHGIESQKIGKVVKRHGIRIKDNGAFTSGESNFLDFL